MKLVDLAIRRPVALSMLVVGILLLGFVSLQKIPLNLLPEITYPKITIRTEYPHAAPREVEERVTKFIESSVGIINKVVKVSSVSRPGWSDVFVEFEWGTDIDLVAMDIREKIQLLDTILPEEVERPILLRYDPTQDPIMVVAVGGGRDLAELRRWVEMNVELELERLDGVAAVKVEGGYEDEIVVELDEEKLAAYALSISAIAERLARENINLASGSLEEGGNKLAVRTVNRFASLEDIRNVIVLEKGASSPATPVSSPRLSSSMSNMPSGAGMPGGLGGLLSGLGNISALMPSAASSTPEASSAVIRLKDIAQVRRQHKERTEIARLNGQECIKVSIFKEGDANVVTVAGRVREALDQIRQRHRSEPRTPEWERELKSPVRKLKTVLNVLTFLFLNLRPFNVPEEPVSLEQGIEIEVISDQSQFILDAIYSVTQNAVIGSVFAVLVLYLFLRNWRSTIIVGIAIPVSFIATFNLMYFRGMSFNIMSLGGLALGVGVLVDSSIIVIENILRWRTVQPDIRLSARRGANEMALPVITGSLTNIIVFFPILYLEGMFRQFFGDLAWTVAFSTLCSALVAITLVPMLSVVLGRRVRLPPALVGKGERGAAEGEEERAEAFVLSAEKPGCVLRLLAAAAGIMRRGISTPIGITNSLLQTPLTLFDRGFRWLTEAYPRLLRRLLRRPFLVSGIALLVGIGSVGMLYHVGWDILPTVDQGEFRLRVELPTGTPIEETNRRIARLEESVRQTEAGAGWLRTLFATVGIGSTEGGSGSEKAENLGEIHVGLSGERKLRDEEIISAVMTGMSDEVGITIRSSKPQLLGYKTPVEIEIEGENLEELRAAADYVMNRIRGVPGLAELESSLGERNPEVNIIIDRDRAAALGLSVSAVTDVIQRKVKGQTATRFDLPEEQLDIVVQLEKDDRATVERLRRITVPGPSGEIQLSQIAEIRTGLGPAAITRSENSRVALIRANIHGRSLGAVVADIEAALADEELPGGCLYRITGQNEEMQRSLPSLYLAIGLALLLVYILLAAEFESLGHPFIIMFCVPFAMVGLALFMLLFNQTINASSLIGILMMIGILDNVAIVLVATINENRDRGMERVEAIVEAGRTRLRPILITNLTTILGMLPLAIAWGPGTELSSPMAMTVIGGLSSATVLTLLVIPCLYLALDILLPRTYQPHLPDLGPEGEQSEGVAVAGSDAAGGQPSPGSGDP